MLVYFVKEDIESQRCSLPTTLILKPMATQDGQVMVESSDKTWSTGEDNGKQLQNSCLENPMNSMKRQKDKTLKDEHSRSVGAQLKSVLK